MPSVRRFVPWLLCVALAPAGACATGNEDDEPQVDAAVVPDARPRPDARRAPDAGPQPDAAPGVPDAAPETADAMAPDAGAVDAAPLDATPAIDAPGAIDAGPVIDAAPGPDAPPVPDGGMTGPDGGMCTLAWENLLDNGNFDSGAVGWDQMGVVIFQQAMVPLLVHSGSHLAWFGGVNSNVRQLSQLVTVPTDAIGMRLLGVRCFVTEEVGGAADFFDIELRNTSGIRVETFSSYSNVDASATCTWMGFERNATAAYAGQMLELRMTSSTDSSTVTSFFLDTLALQALVCR
jgi:hypothetical protein